VMDACGTFHAADHAASGLAVKCPRAMAETTKAGNRARLPWRTGAGGPGARRR
jgi:hypothetical protein